MNRFSTLLIPSLLLLALGACESPKSSDQDGQAESSNSSVRIYFAAEKEPDQVAVLSPEWELVDRSSWDEWGSVIAADQAFTVEDGRLTIHLRAR